jgi:DNA ligase-4
MQFAKLCELLNVLEIRLWKKSLAERRIESARILRAIDCATWPPILLETLFRLLFPSLDRSRKYGIAEYKLSNLIIDIFGLNGTAAGERLRNWKVVAGPSKLQAVGQGDLGTVVEMVMAVIRDSFGSCMQISSIAELLHELSLTCQWSTVISDVVPRNAKDIVKDLYLKIDDKCAKWITRVILKDLRLPLEPQQLMAAFHPILPYLFRMSGCLRHSATIMHKIFKLGCHADMVQCENTLNRDVFWHLRREFCIPYFGQFLAPMQSSQAKSIGHVYSHIESMQSNCSDFVAELKYDGERMQIHYDTNLADPIKIYSKSGRDSTLDRMAAHEVIMKSFREKQTLVNCIVEAELLVYNRSSENIEIFGGVWDFRNDRQNTALTENRNLYIVFFDLLFLNNSSMINESYKDRRKMLEGLVLPIPTYSQLAESWMFKVPARPWNLNSFAPLRSLFMKIVSQNQEGLMVKPHSSKYLPDSRDIWLKLKPDYLRGFGEDCEYALIGASYDPRERYVIKHLEKNEHLFNKYNVGVLCNRDQVIRWGQTPVYRIVSTVVAGFSIDVLRLLTRKLVKNRNAPEFEIQKIYGFPKPECFFAKPEIAKLRTSSFEKRFGIWTLRHPRLISLRTHEVDQVDCVTFSQLQSFGESTIVKDADQKSLETVLLELDQSYSDPQTLDTHSKSEQTLGNSTVHDYWVFSCTGFNPAPTEYQVRSISAILHGCGWECNRSDHTGITKKSDEAFFEKLHRPGIFIINAEECDEFLAWLESKLETMICKNAQPVYIVDKSWQGGGLDDNSLLATLDPSDYK